MKQKATNLHLHSDLNEFRCDFQYKHKNVSYVHTNTYFFWPYFLLVSKRQIGIVFLTVHFRPDPLKSFILRDLLIWFFLKFD
jgi:hypothetical protein